MTVPVLLKLAEGLGVDAGWLLRGPGDEPVWVEKDPAMAAGDDDPIKCLDF
jgi:hypothetical protein